MWLRLWMRARTRRAVHPPTLRTQGLRIQAEGHLRVGVAHLGHHVCRILPFGDEPGGKGPTERMGAQMLGQRIAAITFGYQLIGALVELREVVRKGLRSTQVRQVMVNP